MNSIEENLKNNNWTPLHTRIISHRIGDGTVNYYGHYVWDNKNPHEFIDLTKKLEIKIWGPTLCKKWGTSKIIIHKNLFLKFGEIIETDGNRLLRNPAYFIETIRKMPRAHKLQTLFALLVDDGSCINWMLTLFEDQHKEVVNSVYQLWNDLCPSTAKISELVTPKGTRVYHIQINREGIIFFKNEVDKAVNEFGELAGIWWKQEPLNRRYEKATNRRALLINDTKNKKELKDKILIDYLTNRRSATFTEIKNILSISTDRARRILRRLAKEKKLFLIDAGNKARYSMVEENISQEYREQIILHWIEENQSVGNKEIRKLFKIGSELAGVILNRMCKKKLLKKVNNYQKARYILFS